jgi:regulation of enolase protein 1 (concanavalin A-like superfamily)
LLGAPAALAQQSDDFNTCELDPGLWRVADPVGDASVSVVGVGTSDPKLEIDVPAGSSHEPWTTNTAVRVLQPMIDTDLSVEAKFDSVLSATYQLEGILVQQADDVFLRFEFHYRSGSYYGYAASVNGGSAKTIRWKSLPEAPRYMRVSRIGDDWTYEWAGADQTFTTFATFNHPMVVTEVGPYAGNYDSSNAPAHTALVDYFFATAAPIVPEDAAALPQDRTLTLLPGAGGSIAPTPSQPFYSCADTVSLTAVADAGYSFGGWSDDLAGNVNPETIDMAIDRTVGASFTPDVAPPQISAISITPGHDSMLVTWTTDRPASSHVEWGETASYELGAIDDPTLVTSHSVTVIGLTPETLYHVQVSSSEGGTTGVSADLLTTTTLDPASVPSGFVSDDFNDCEVNDLRWSVVDPVGDGIVDLVGVGTADARLLLDIPGGTEHNPWTSNDSLRALQTVNDTDFSIALKFDSVLTQGYQMQGLTVQESPTHYVRLEFYHDGTTQRAFAAHFAAGSSTIVSDTPIASDAHLRATRTGDTFELSHSPDGVAWTVATSFDHVLVVSAIGPHAGNYPLGGTIPANTVLVDYAFTTLAPKLPEDGGSPPQDKSLSVSVVGNGSVSVSPDQPLYACNDVVTLTATPGVDQIFTTWSGDLTGNVNPETLDMAANRLVIATFDAYVEPPGISNIQVTTDPGLQTATITWSTLLDADSAVEYGETTGYELGSVSSSTPTQSHSIDLTSLVPGIEYHYRVTSVTSEGGSETSADGTFTVPLLPGQDSSGIFTDDFNTCAVDTTFWRVSDPRGDGSVSIQGAGSGDAQILLSVPAGQSHEPWKNDTSLSLLQPTNDVDFALEAKFDSVLSLRFQQQGILAKESDTRFMRFELYSDGVSTYGLVAYIDNGSASVLINSVVPATSAYLQVARVGDDWTMLYSDDGVSWTPLGTETQAIVAAEVGVYGGNFDPGTGAPAHTAIVDYFHNTALSLANEDVGVPPANVTLTTSASGPGTVNVSPTGPTYSCGQEVTLWATAQPGYEFIGWTGDITGGQAARSFSLVDDALVIGNFVPDMTAPVIESIAVVAGPAGAEVQIVADELTTYVLRYGLTTGYEIDTIVGTTLATEHAVVLQGLTALTDYHFEVTLEDTATNSSVSSDQIFTTAGPPGSGPAGIYSDDFNSCAVDTGLWTVFDPLFDASFVITGAGAGDAKLEVSIPGGVAHGPGAVNNSARLMQPITNADFEVEIRFDSALTLEYQEQGILVEADPQTYLRFDFHSDGTSNFAFAGIIDINGASSEGSVPIVPTTTQYMRVSRVGDLWTQSYSYDGLAWNVANQFTYVITVSNVGFFAGNEPGTNSPAHTAIVDYFWASSSPIVPEDVGSVGGAKSLTVLLDGPGSVSVDPDQPQYGCGEAVQVTADPDPGYSFDSWSGDLSGSDSPETLAMTVDRTITGHFILDTVPPVISNVAVARGPSSAVVTWTTNEPTTSRIDFGLTTSYELGYVEDLVPRKQHTMVVPGLDSAQSYHLEITATDGASFQTLSGDILSGPAEGPIIDLFHGTSQTFAANGLPQPMLNVLGNAADPDGVASLTWSLNGGLAYPLSIGGDTYRLDLAGDFNVEIPAGSIPVGLNTLLIRATDSFGNESVELMMLDYVDSPVPTMPMFIDWTTAPDIQSLAQTVDGDWALDVGGLRTQEMGYDRIVAIGDMSWTDYEATVRLTMNELEPYFLSPSNAPALGVIARWAGHPPDGNQPSRQWFPVGAFAAVRFYQGGGQTAILYGDSGLTHDSGSIGGNIEIGAVYVMKIRVETLGNGDTLYNFKMWREIDGEPVGWLLTGTEVPAQDVPSGSLLLVAHHVDVTWHDVDIQPVP